MNSSMEEVFQFLKIETRTDLKAVSLQYVLGLTGNEEGKEILLRQSKFFKALLELCNDESTSIAKDALLTLVNISAEESGSRALMDNNEDIVSSMLNIILDAESQLADPACMILSNLSRPMCLAEKISNLIESSNVKIDKLVEICSNTSYNKRGARLHYLAPLLSNLTQTVSVRRQILNSESGLIHHLLPFTEYMESNVRRGGVVGVLRNCCFERDCHDYLLSSDVDILPRLLLPLAGPEEFDDEDNEKLPIELQYLSPDKVREEDPDIRKMLLESLQQLCASKKSRELLRERNVYIILRELHKVEKERSVLLSCENVVDILIRTEDEMDEEHTDLKSVKVPEDLHERFKKMDEDFINDT